MATATRGLNRGSLRKIQSLLAQQRAAGGRVGKESEDLRTLLEAEIGATAERASLEGVRARSLELEEKRIGTQKEQFAESMAFSVSQATTAKEEADKNRLERERRAEEAASAAKTAGAIDVAGTVAETYLGYKMLGAMGGKAGVGTATGVSAPATSGGLSATGATPGATQGAPATGGGGVSGTSAGGLVAAAIIGDALVARGASGETPTHGERSRRVSRSVTEYFGLTVGQVELAKKHGILSPKELAIKEDIPFFGGEGAEAMDVTTEAIADVLDEVIPTFVTDIISDFGF